MKKVVFLFLSISIFGFQSINAQSKKELKKQQQEKEYENTKKLIESGNFTFNPDWVNTQRGRRVNIAGDGNYLKFKGKTTTADLPFFGEAYSGSYGGSGGIVFSNSDTTYGIEYNDKKMKINIKFKASEKSESFDVILEIFSNKNGTLRVNSSNRSVISYNGKIFEGNKAEE